MPITAQIVGAPHTITVAAADLQSAIANARPGTVIQVTQGALVTLSLNGVTKADPGVAVQMPPGQQYRVIANGGTPNVHFYGGEISGGFGLTQQPNAVLLTDISKMSFNGVLCRGGKNQFVATRCTDLDWHLCRFLEAGADGGQYVDSSRVRWRDCVFSRPRRGSKICVFNDGSQPVRDATGDCAANGGRVLDGPHHDAIQLRNLSGTATDSIITGNLMDWEGQGVFINPACTRAVVTGNTARITDTHAFSANGTDVLLADNAFGQSLRQVGVFPNKGVTLFRAVAGQRIAGGRNTYLGPGGVPTYTGDLGAALGGPVIVGDAVNPPEPPRLFRPGWFPSYSLPADPSATGAPEVDVTLDWRLLWWNGSGGLDGPTPATSGATVPQNTWITSGYPQFFYNGATGLPSDNTGYVWRWRANGVLIGGATTQVKRATEAPGTVLQVECAVSANGVTPLSAWAQGPSVTVA